MRRSDPFAPVERPKRAIPYDFVLEELAELEPTTRAMFGSTAIYLDDRVVFILRQKGDSDDGVWLAYEAAAEAKVLALLPALKPIDRLGNVRCWKKLAANSVSFEEDVLRACRLLRADDSVLGKVPDRQKKKRAAVAPKTSKTRGARETTTRPARRRT